ncbi:hypothetical protein MRX96_058128 [Rhipicephalus microplus]
MRQYLRLGERRYLHQGLVLVCLERTQCGLGQHGLRGQHGLQLLQRTEACGGEGRSESGRCGGSEGRSEHGQAEARQESEAARCGGSSGRCDG